LQGVGAEGKAEGIGAALANAVGEIRLLAVLGLVLLLGVEVGALVDLLVQVLRKIIKRRTTMVD